jgi:hypothetical protein
MAEQEIFEKRGSGKIVFIILATRLQAVVQRRGAFVVILQQQLLLKGGCGVC